MAKNVKETLINTMELTKEEGYKTSYTSTKLVNLMIEKLAEKGVLYEGDSLKEELEKIDKVDSKKILDMSEENIYVFFVESILIRAMGAVRELIFKSKSNTEPVVIELPDYFRIVTEHDTTYSLEIMPLQKLEKELGCEEVDMGKVEHAKEISLLDTEIIKGIADFIVSASAAGKDEVAIDITDEIQGAGPVYKLMMEAFLESLKEIVEHIKEENKDLETIELKVPSWFTIIIGKKDDKFILGIDGEEELKTAVKDDAGLESIVK